MLIILKTTGLNILFLLATGSALGNKCRNCVGCKLRTSEPGFGFRFVGPNGARSSAYKSLCEADLTNL